MSAINSQDAWDEICVNPHQSQMEIGRQEGRVAGLQAGFNDGFALGRTKSIEFGIELGFISGFLDTLERRLQLSSNPDDAAQNARLQKRVQELRRSMSHFPSPDSMFPSDVTHAHVVTDEKDDSEKVTRGTDVLGSMQIIRAKFKTITAQMKLPHYSLKGVMDSAAQMENEMDDSSISNVVISTKAAQNSGQESQRMTSDW